ncbi:MAG: endonuclease III [Anaerolineae bacterium]
MIDEIYETVVRTYGARDLQAYDDPLKQLILTILSHRTTWIDEKNAFDAMWNRYGTWEAIRDAPPDELIDLLAPVRYPERKGPYIQGTLARILAERGEASINFLRDMPTEDAMRWLMSLPGVGLKTASLVMLFCFHHPVIPVDTHVHRVSQRLGLIGAKTSADAAHSLLLTMLGPDPYRLYNFHKAMMKHGQQICTYSAPKCHRCPLAHLCAYHLARVHALATPRTLPEDQA